MSRFTRYALYFPGKVGGAFDVFVSERETMRATVEFQRDKYLDMNQIPTSHGHLYRTVWALLCLRLWSRPIYSCAVRVKTGVYHGGPLLVTIIPHSNVIHAHKCA